MFVIRWGGGHHSDLIIRILSSSESVISHQSDEGRSYHCRNTHTGHHRPHQTGPVCKWAEKHPGDVTSPSQVWLESKQFSSTLICSDQNFCPERGRGTRNSKVLGRNVFREFYNLPAFAELWCPELDTSVPLSTWTQDTRIRPSDCPDTDIKTNPFVKIFTLIMSRNKTPNPVCVCPGGPSPPPSLACHYHS